MARHPHRRGATAAGRRAVRGICGAPVTCFVVVLRPLAGRKLNDGWFATDEDTYATALTFIAERFQRFLADHDSHGIMVVDSRRPEVDDRMRRFFERLQREGTPYQRLERIVDALFLGPSHYSIGLQAADLVVAIDAGSAERPAGRRQPLAQAVAGAVRAPSGDREGGRRRAEGVSEPAGAEEPAAKLFTAQGGGA